MRYTSHSKRPSMILASVMMASLVIGVACKSTTAGPSSDESRTMMYPGATRGEGGFLYSVTSKLMKKGQDKIVVTAKEKIKDLAHNKDSRDSLVLSLCARLPPAQREACIKHATVSADFTAGAGKALTKDIQDAADGVKELVSNPEEVAHGIFRIGEQIVSDPTGTISDYASQAKALKDDVIECWNSGAEGRGTVIGHAGLLILPEAKAAEAVKAASLAEKVVTVGSKGAAVITEVKKHSSACQKRFSVDADGNQVLETTLVVPSLISPSVEVY